MRALVFGSSIAEGYWATAGGWVQLLIQDVAQRHVRDAVSADQGDWVMNVGVGGDTVGRVASRLAGEAEARRGPYGGELTLVFAIGGNDAMQIAGRPMTETEDFTRGLGRLRDLAVEITPRVMFVGLTPMDPAAQLVRDHFDQDRLRHFDSLIHQSARSAGLPFVPVMDEFQVRGDRGEQLLSFDGVHPSDAGQRVIHDLVRPELARWLPDLGD